MSVNVGQAVGYLMLDTSNYTSGFKSALSDLKTFQDSSATTKDKLTSLSSAMGQTGKSLTKFVTVPLAGVGAAMVKTTADFEAGMSQVQAISGATGKDLEALSEKAKEMGAKTKFSATESAEALKYMAMAGWDTQKMLDGLPGVMNLAAASGEDLGTVSDIVTDALTALGMKAEEAGHFADVLAQASSKSNTNVGLMGQTFQYVAPVAGALGFSCEDTAVAIGLMANAGIKGSKAGTALRSTLSRLSKPTAEVKAAMYDLGISITNSDGTMKSFMEIMEDMRTSFAGLTEAEKASYAATIGGQEAMSGLLAIVNTSEKDFSKLVEQIYNADGAAEQMANTMQDNLSGQLTILKSTIEGISISFGEIMLPVVKKVVSGLQSFATWLNNTSDTTKKVIVIVATLIATLGPALLIGSKLISGISKITSLVFGFGGALTFLTNPIGIVIAAVAALALAWATDFGGIRDKTKEIMSSIKDIITSIVEAIKYAWENNIGGMRTIVKTVFAAIELIFETVLDVISGIFEMFAGIFTGDWERFWNGLKKVLKSIIDAIKKIVKGFFDWISEGVKKAIDKLKSLGEKSAETQAERKSGSSSTTGGNKRKVKGYANGLAYVPYDGFPAILHKGERVLTAEESKAYNEQPTAKGASFNFVFNSPAELSPAEARRQSVKAMNEILFNM